jgi:DNA-binding response OmpR family regulator
MSGRSEEWVPSPEAIAAVLEVSALPADGLRLQEILSQGSWKLHEASDCCETLALSRDESVPVLRCERDHADGNRDDLLTPQRAFRLRRILIVFSRLAEESFWAKVLSLGGFDVLMTPFEPEEVLRVAFSAWSRWECGFVASSAREAEAANRSRMSGFSDE